MANTIPPGVPESEDVVMTEEETTRHPITPTKGRKRKALDTPEERRESLWRLYRISQKHHIGFGV
ncbi:hypothetical protein D6D10_03278 [Aureobasidium pullulans]|uniref:Uncharacterized protein n=1 Tax=Aureobasidium pullulans TaxID=5580 RepID=A0A4S9F055_AURPU|nr:hypothetical protein D6D10_03278 [Aureobasidium pullulans]